MASVDWWEVNAFMYYIIASEMNDWRFYMLYLSGLETLPFRIVQHHLVILDSIEFETPNFKENLRVNFKGWKELLKQFAYCIYYVIMKKR